MAAVMAMIVTEPTNYKNKDTNIEQLNQELLIACEGECNDIVVALWKTGALILIILELS